MTVEDDIIPRDIRFGIREHATRHWYDGDLIKTFTADGLSIFLPESPTRKELSGFSGL